jgi:hypothetical protein
MSSKRPSKRPTKAQVEQRVAEVLSIRLAGAQFWDVKELIRERECMRGAEGEERSPWQLADGQKPLSDSQIWRYIQKADELIASGCLASRKKLLRRHRARREYLYGLALDQADVRAALACLRDAAELEGLYPPKKVAPTTPDGSREYGALSEAEIQAGIAALAARVGDGRGGPAGGEQAAPP